MSKTTWLVCATVCILWVLTILPVAAQDVPPGVRSDAIGIGFFYLSPDAPLEAGAGFRLGYSHRFDRRRLSVKTGLSLTSLDREAEGIAQAGQIDLWILSAGVLWAVGPRSSAWTLNVGGGLDLVDGDGEGSFAVPGPIAIQNTFDVDLSAGLHADFDAIRALGQRWQISLGLRYLAATVDGAHRFVVDGVEGAPLPVDFEIGGPQLAIGFDYRF